MSSVWTLRREPTYAELKHRKVLAVVWNLFEEQSCRACTVAEIVERFELIGDSPHWWDEMTSGKQSVRNALQALERDGHVERADIGAVVAWAPIA